MLFRTCRKKRALGRRLALGARSLTYGQYWGYNMPVINRQYFCAVPISAASSTEESLYHILRVPRIFRVAGSTVRT